MSKIDAETLKTFRGAIDSPGDTLRIHLISARSGMLTRARMWHHDGAIIGSASGCGYDKRGAALGQAMELLFTQEELAKLPLPVRRKNGSVETGLYGLREYTREVKKRGKVVGTVKARVIDGACGLESVLKILRALGFDVDLYETGPLTSMVLARRK